MRAAGRPAERGPPPGAYASGRVREHSAVCALSARAGYAEQLARCVLSTAQLERRLRCDRLAQTCSEWDRYGVNFVKALWVFRVAGIARMWILTRFDYGRIIIDCPRNSGTFFFSVTC